MKEVYFRSVSKEFALFSLSSPSLSPSWLVKVWKNEEGREWEVNGEDLSRKKGRDSAVVGLREREEGRVDLWVSEDKRGMGEEEEGGGGVREVGGGEKE